jgi:hypothetical protein
MEDVVNAVITCVDSIGKSADGSHAYVQCSFRDGTRQAIFFSPESAPTVCTAFLSATGALQIDQVSPDGVAVAVPIPVDHAFLSIGKRPGNPEAVLVTFAIGGTLCISNCREHACGEHARGAG